MYLRSIVEKIPKTKDILFGEELKFWEIRKKIMDGKPWNNLTFANLNSIQQISELSAYQNSIDAWKAYTPPSIVKKKKM